MWVTSHTNMAHSIGVLELRAYRIEQVLLFKNKQKDRKKILIHDNKQQKTKREKNNTQKKMPTGETISQMMFNI